MHEAYQAPPIEVQGAKVGKKRSKSGYIFYPVTATYKLLKLGQIPYSLKFSRIKYFTVLPNSAQKQIFVV